MARAPEEMREEMAANRRRWDEMVAINLGSDLYRLEAFKRGERRGLHGFEWDAIGPLAGLRVLHLQCHFGLDTLALARAGARVTGLDYSAPAIAEARMLAAELVLDASFVEGNVYDAPALIAGPFDLVYVTWGTICWLPDVVRWAEIVAGFLVPGGRFFFCDAHPCALTLDEGAEPPSVRYPYFHKPEPLRFDDIAPYADASARLDNASSFEWIHPLSEVVMALLAAGLTLERLTEHPFCAWQLLPQMIAGEDGLWRLPDGWPSMALSYSLLARKPAA